MDLKSLLGPMRVPFLVLAPACWFLGLASAIWSGGDIRAWYALLTLIGAVSAHISVNALNEYFDFKSGLDYRTQRTPFSGGSGTLPARPELARSAFITGLTAAAVTALVGIYFLWVRGWGLLPIGLLGLLVIFTYTPWLNRSPILCLIAPGLGFGTFMVMGTAFALSGTYDGTKFFASLVPFFLVSNLLLLNQFPDVEADRSVGRLHLPVVVGRKASAGVYIAFLLCSYLSILIGILLGLMPVWTLLGLGTLVLAVPVIRNVYQNADQLDQLMPSLGMNVQIVLLTPVLTGIGFLIG